MVLPAKWEGSYHDLTGKEMCQKTCYAETDSKPLTNDKVDNFSYLRDWFRLLGLFI